MKNSHVVPLLYAMLMLALPGAFAAEVANVSFEQRPGTRLVDITYDLVGEATETSNIEVLYSLDGGADGFPYRAQSVTGDVGAVLPGVGRRIVWTAERDILGVQVSNAILRVCARADIADITVYLPGDVPLVMVPIPAGSFQMGSDDPGWSFLTEQPVHTVTFAQLFYMGQYPVTQRQWLAVMGADPPDLEFSGRDEAPVDGVSRDDCEAFVTALNNHIAVTGQGPATFRLPSEAEWEYACRAGTTTRFYFGDSNCATGCAMRSCDLLDYAWWCGNDSGSGQVPTRGTKPVGQKLPNAWGLYDMHGNVWERCLDWWNEDYLGAPTDGSPWYHGDSRLGVIRGGYWNSGPRNCRSATRGRFNPDLWRSALGFRLAWTW